MIHGKSPNGGHMLLGRVQDNILWIRKEMHLTRYNGRPSRKRSANVVRKSGEAINKTHKIIR